MLLKKYVKLFQTYFGKKNLMSKVHLVTHLLQVLRNWGPLWVHEAFIFEARNKRIIDFITSPHAQTNQVATRFLMHKFSITFLHDETVSPATKKFIVNLLRIPIGNDRVDIKTHDQSHQSQPPSHQTSRNQQSQPPKSQYNMSRSHPAALKHTLSFKSDYCHCCEGNHFIVDCPKF